MLNHSYICRRLWGHGSCIGTTLLPPPVRVLPLHAPAGVEAFVNSVADMFADGVGTDEVGALGGVIRGCECLDGGDRWFSVTREDIIMNLVRLCLSSPSVTITCSSTYKPVLAFLLPQSSIHSSLTLRSKCLTYISCSTLTYSHVVPISSLGTE